MFCTRRKVGFQPQKFYVTDKAKAVIEENNVTIELLVLDHADGDWGDVSPAVWKANDLALAKGTMVFSVFQMDIAEHRLLVITMPDRKKTFVQLPEEL